MSDWNARPNLWFAVLTRLILFCAPPLGPPLYVWIVMYTTSYVTQRSSAMIHPFQSAKLAHSPPLCGPPGGGLPAPHARGAPKWLKRTCRHCSHARTWAKAGDITFGSCGTDLYMMAFIYELDLNILKMYLQTKNGLSRSRLSKDIVGQTLRHAHIRTTHIGLQTDSGDQKHYHAPSRVVNIVTTVYRPGADPGFWNGGAQVERRRREYRGAVGAEGVEFGEGVSPSPMEVGSGEGAVPPPQKNF